MTQLGRHSPREDFRNRVVNLRIAAALTISVSRDPEAHGPQDGIEPSPAEVFNRPQPVALYGTGRSSRGSFENNLKAVDLRKTLEHDCGTHAQS
jgi:hypothetical protein